MTVSCCCYFYYFRKPAPISLRSNMLQWKKVWGRAPGTCSPRVHSACCSPSFRRPRCQSVNWEWRRLFYVWISVNCWEDSIRCKGPWPKQTEQGLIFLLPIPIQPSLLPAKWIKSNSGVKLDCRRSDTEMLTHHTAPLSSSLGQHFLNY